MKQTKIVCTIGPSSSDEATLKRLVEAGMNVARLNFSHGTHESHKKTFNLIREVAPNVAILIDLCGPKIRTGELEEAYNLNIGDKLKMVYATYVILL